MLKPPAVLPTSAEVSILAVAWVGTPNNKTNSQIQQDRLDDIKAQIEALE
jgi:hypothetical protein